MTTSAQPIARRSPAATLADLVALPGVSSPLVRDALLVVGGAALTAGAAQVAFQMPWSPVPYTLQTGAVLLVGTALGMRRGALSMLLYVLAGLFLPIYADGASGIERLLGFTGGYLVAFILAAALVGRLAERGWDRSWRSTALLMVAGTLLFYVLGVPVLAIALGMPLGDAIWNGAAVFVPWDVAKIVAAMIGLPLAWRLAGANRA